MRKSMNTTRRIVLVLLSCLFSLSGVVAEDQTSSPARKAGPRIIPINYEQLFAMPEPPSYEPFPVYGEFLFSVAGQKTPLVMNPRFPVPDSVKKTPNVVFKTAPGSELAVDVYQPTNDTSPNPLILIIHGGYWKHGDKSIHAQQGVEFAELGYTAASVNYRLSAEHKFPANIEDIYDCLKFLIENAKRFNIDPNRIVTYGGSAGGHLSAFIGLAANTKGRSWNRGINSNAIKGVITLYGMHDLTLQIQREHPFTEKYIGASFEDAGDVYREASPIYHVDADDPPVLLIHGSLDGSVSVKNSDALSSRLKTVGVPFKYDRVKGWPHAMDAFSPIGERSLWHIHRFLRNHMPSDEMKK